MSLFDAPLPEWVEVNIRKTHVERPRRFGDTWLAEVLLKRRARDSGNYSSTRADFDDSGCCHIIFADLMSALFPLYPPGSPKSWRTSDTHQVPLSCARSVLHSPTGIKVRLICPVTWRHDSKVIVRHFAPWKTMSHARLIDLCSWTECPLPSQPWNGASNRPGPEAQPMNPDPRQKHRAPLSR